LFADPIADLAILGCPDDQELSEQAEAYEALVEPAAALEIVDAPRNGQARHSHHTEGFRPSGTRNFLYVLS
jgi:hypothetical protein